VRLCGICPYHVADLGRHFDPDAKHNLCHDCPEEKERVHQAREARQASRRGVDEPTVHL